MKKIKLLLEQLELLVEKKDHLINRIDSLTSVQKDEIISFFQKYPQHESKINWNQLDTLSYGDFKKVMEVPATIPIKSGDAVEGEDYIEVDSLHQFHKAFIPLNWEGSKYLASNAVGKMEGEWCIAYRESDNYWESHFKYGVFIIYVTTKGKYAIKITRPDFTEIDSLWSKKNKDIGAKVFNEETGNDAYDLISKNKKHFSHPSLKYDPFKPISNGDIDAVNCGLTSLEGAPESVEGDFYCSRNKLTTLKGAPKKINKNFICRSNPLISLEGAPEEVLGSFDCDNGQLKSLKGAPKKVGNIFSCRDHELESLIGCPDVGYMLDCGGNKLTNLKGIPKQIKWSILVDSNLLTSLQGAPETVKGNFDCSNNKLENLDGAPQTVGEKFTCSKNKLVSLEGGPTQVRHYNCKDNNLTSLKGAPEFVEGNFDCSNNDITSLEGIPKIVKGDFICWGQKQGRLSKADIRSACDVKGSIKSIKWGK